MVRKRIDQQEVNNFLKSTCNNVALWASGFSWSFYMVFLEIEYMSVMQKLKGDKDQRYLRN